MLSTIPKLADKSFILGFVLPVFLVVLVGLWLFSDVPPIDTLLNVASHGDSLEKLVSVVISIWTLSILMLTFNHAQFQILEGYRWPLSRWTSRKERHRRRYQEMAQRLRALRAEQRQHLQNNTEFPVARLAQMVDLWVDLRKIFPADENDILPTRFGNAIKAFEGYSEKVYGADSVILWPHLGTVIAKDFQEGLASARAKVDCLVNLSWFSALIFLAATARLIWNLGSAFEFDKGRFDWNGLCAGANLSFVLAAAVAAILARVTYALSIEQIYLWGDLVRAAFDCYLPALASKLGYKLPHDTERQRKFWEAVARRASLYVPLRVEDWPTADAAEPPPAPPGQAAADAAAPGPEEHADAEPAEPEDDDPDQEDDTGDDAQADAPRPVP
jgi:hypothetical protein